MADARPTRRPGPARIAAALTASALLSLPAALPAAAATAFSLSGVGAPLGMATDHERGRYWVVAGATSGRLTLHAFASDGTPEGRMTSRDSVTNVQALAFVDDEAFVGDVGGRRQEVSVWNVMAPWPGTEINHAIRYRFTYPDGQHQALAILVDASHRMHVVTSGDNPGIYQAPQGPPADEAVALTRVADAPAGVTDGVVLLDGRVALRTETALVVLDPATWASAGETTLAEGQEGQSLAQGVDQAQALAAAGSEGEVEAVEIPGEPPSEPTAAATDEADPVPAAEPEDTRTFDQTGTTTAIAGAVGLAVLAMLVVLVRR